MKKLFSILMTVVLAAAVTGCSKDDEPSDYENTKDGITIYIDDIQALYKDGKPDFYESTTPGVYLAKAESFYDASSYVAYLIDSKDWDGKAVTVKLGENGKDGSLVITPYPENNTGIYYRINVNVKGDIENYPPFTLLIFTQEYADSENGQGYIGGGTAGAIPSVSAPQP